MHPRHRRCRPAPGRTFQKATFKRTLLLAPVLAWLKPMLRRFTSVDFGKLTYAEEVQQIADAAGLEILEDKPVPGSVDNQWQTARLVVMADKKSK